MKHRIYLVGGAVRDKLLGKQSKDLDFAVEAESYSAMKEDLIARGVKIFQERPEFLTIRGNHPEYGGVDYVLCRKDGAYSDGRRPDSVEVGTILDDLSRRDFTMNAIAERENGNLYDPFHGYEDIQNKIIRCVGNSYDRFNEDKLRIFRALRFAVTLDFKIDPETANSISIFDTLYDFSGVSTERIQIEMWKAFGHDTLMTIQCLNDYAPHLFSVMARKGIRLKPTLER